MLVFLPGGGEIRRVEEALDDLAGRVEVLPLHGSLPQEAQERAIAPSPPGRRKVVLATNIAETSLTIEGVRVVVDTGRMRVPRFSPRTGMTSLETVPVSRASADQRRGRAGRLAPGVCYRLWSEGEQHGLVPHGTPEILQADLAPLALELAAWGVEDPTELRWLDAPPPAAFGQARELLAQLGALDADGRITPHGRAMAETALHPRLAHLLLRARALGKEALACDLAALLSESDLLRGEGAPADPDLRLRLELLRDARAGRIPGSVRGARVNRGGVHGVLAEARHWRAREGARGEGDPEDAGLLLAFAFPDRIAQRRAGQRGRFLLRNGRGASLPDLSALAEAPYLVAAELDDRGREGRLFQAAPLAAEELEAHFADQVERAEVIAWDPETRSVRARREERLGALLLKESALAEPDPIAVAGALLAGVRGEGLDALPWSREARALQQRLIFLRRHVPKLPDVSDATLVETAETWLLPHLYGKRRWDEVQRLDLSAVLEGMLPWEQRTLVEEEAPTHLEVPSGSRIRVDYSDPGAPVLAVRLQEVFGWMATPRIARGRVPLTLHLLSPAQRPVQVTRDLESFWERTYFEVKKDLKGRYPKHYWPDDPRDAIATRRVRPR